MKRMLCVTQVIALLATAALAQVSSPAARGGEQASFPASKSVPKYRAGALIVRFKAKASAAQMAAAHAAAQAQVVRPYHVVKNLQLVHLSEGMSVMRALRAYQKNPAVQYAEPDFTVQAVGVNPNDPRYLDGSQWDLKNTGQNGGTAGADIGASSAWSLTTGSSDVVVGDIDTGIDYNHADLAANVWSAPFSFTVNGLTCPIGSHGFNAAYNSCDPYDDHGHGTHTAGTIGARTNNGIGVAGVNWNVTVVACKFLNSQGWGYSSDAIVCLEFLKDLKDNHGLNLVATNNSWGGGGYDQALADAIDAHRQSGILFIAAAGNAAADNDGGGFYPANYYLPNVISVAATDRNDALATFSDYGKRTVHLGAPGVSIISTTPNNTYSTWSGTSMATPHVTGVAALLAAQDPSRDWRAIKNLILAGGDTKPSLVNTITGERLNANGSLTCSNSALLDRLLPVGDSPTAMTGATVPMAVLHINCADPAGYVVATINPGGAEVVLVDDGAAPDQAAGDGIYTGQFTAGSPGQYTVSIDGGETFPLVVTGPYYYQPAPYNYRVITGTDLSFTDECGMATITPSFPIHFDGRSFNSLMVNGCGYVSFDSTWSGFFYYGSLPWPGYNTVVAPFAADMLEPNAAQNVFWEETGSAPNRELVIEWRNVTLSPMSDGSGSPDESVTFQVVFFEDKSDILFNYADVVFGGDGSGDYGEYSNVGVQFADGTANMFSWDQPTLGNNTALLWTTTGPDLTLPAPTVTSLSPSTAQVGGPDFTLTVNGSNFLDSSVVRWDGSDRPTTFVNSTQLTASIGAGDIASGQTAWVSVFTFDGGEAGLPFYVSDPDFSFSASSLSPGQARLNNPPSSGSVTLAAKDGFASDVTLSCAVAPAGPGCSAFSPASVTPPGSATFTVSAGAGTAQNYTVTVTGTGGGKSHSVDLPYAIWDYAITGAPSSAIATSGTTTGYTFKLHPLNGAQNVDVSCMVGSGLPGATCSIQGPLNPVSLAVGNVNMAVALTLPASNAPCISNCTLTVHTVDHDVPSAPAREATITITVQPTFPSPVGLNLVPITPCRLVDTRLADGPYGGPALVGANSRDFPLSSQTNPTNSCGIPATAQAYSLNLTVVPHGLPVGFVTAYPCGQPRPVASNLNSDGRVKAVAAIVPGGTNGDVCIYASSATDLVVDIDGYFVPNTDPSALAFYPVTPCRLVDTRNPEGALGGPTLAGGSTRTFPLLSGSCGIPATAQAYSLNYTVVPRQSVLSFLTTWPAGQSQPLVSTLNATTGVVTANAAIVPAGTSGDVNVYVTQNIDLVIDVNGYFAPAGAGGLSLYVLTPCRVLDTRSGGAAPFSGQIDVNVVAAGCGAPTSAQAFVLNATAVPAVTLSYLTLWPQGSSKPTVSTMNSVDGSVVSNLAIVPTTNGSISAYAGSATQLVLDISAFFAP